MRLTFAGSGSAFCFTEDRFQSNMVLETDGPNPHRLLIDCGSDARRSLGRLGLGANDIDAVYISHVHSDHIGGLEWFAFNRYFCGCGRKPALYAVESLLPGLWENSLKGGLELADCCDRTLRSYFEPVPLDPDTGFTWHDVSFDIAPCPHIITEAHSMLSYGLLGQVADFRFFLSTDVRFDADFLTPYWHQADIIFQDCELCQRHSGVHAHYDDLRRLPAAIKRKMWLYHYQCGPRPDAIADGFAGFVETGQSFALAHPAVERAWA